MNTYAMKTSEEKNQDMNEKRSVRNVEV